MAWKHRQRRASDSDMIDPEDWNENNREFVNEFNGFLDRDNIQASAIGREHLKPATFGFITSRKSKGAYVLTGGSTAYEGSLTSKRLDLNYNGMLICEFSGYFHFRNPIRATTTFPDVGFQAVNLRILVDGVEVAKAHSISEFSQSHSFYLCGAIPVDSGMHMITTEAMTSIRKDSHGGSQMKASFDGNLRPVDILTRELVVTYRRR